MDTETLRVRIARQHIGLLCSLVAGYEELAIVRTLDAQQGLVELLVAPAFYTILVELLQAIEQEMALGLTLVED